MGRRHGARPPYRAAAPLSVYGIKYGDVGAAGHPCSAKRLECVQLAGAIVKRGHSKSGSKLRALQTLRAQDRPHRTATRHPIYDPEYHAKRCMKPTSFWNVLDGVPNDPFYQPRKPLWLPPEMAMPPSLDDHLPTGPIERRYALLVNPFYPKSPHGSFGKHVLTPSLALTSIASATPAHWRVRYWDENLLQGPPPARPLPEAVGISVHLTFARRAYRLATQFREQPLRILVAHFQAERGHQQQHEHQGDHDHGIVLAA